ncbi:MAG TPA: PEP-CTERM sorting domain-containing protein [Verrucomicrobiae bacterium]|nr:PEP-CTERM sorting domain-containing protein [Verrucomicrobiae bacterium]
MKKAALILLSIIGAAGMASASTPVSYTATGAPGSNPDGVDQNSTPVQVWTQTQGVGGSGSGFGTWTLIPNYWQMYSYPDGNNVIGTITDTHMFDGGALAIGQTVSLAFEMSATNPHTDVGVDLLNGSGAAVTFGIYGAEPDATNPYYTGSGYFYSDAGSGGDVSAGSMGYQYHSAFNISFTVTGANSYSAVAGTDSWSGTFSGSLLGIDVFNNAAGNGSDVAFNNLTVVPEPSAWAMLLVGGMTLLGRRRIFRRA